MTRASRLSWLLRCCLFTVALAGGAPAGAAAPTIKSISALTTRAGCAVLSNGTAQCSGGQLVGPARQRHPHQQLGARWR